MLLVGIDEAGYGPLLGPLVVSGVALRLPDELGNLPLWQLLGEGLTDRAAGAKGRIVVADSKKVFHGKDRDLRELERSALGAVMLSTGSMPETFDQLLALISLEPEPHLSHPWYCHRLLALPCRVPLDGLRLSAAILSREFTAVNGSLLCVKSVPLVERRYNFLVKQTRNKSEIVFAQTARILSEILAAGPDPNVRIAVDKQGGKDHYVRNLLRSFPDAKLTIVCEGPERSEYILGFSRAEVRIEFCQKGETKHLLVAWASILSKYLRELFMIQFNAYWSQHLPKLSPTAGYWEDGRRFIQEVQPILEKLHIPSSELLRQL